MLPCISGSGLLKKRPKALSLTPMIPAITPDDNQHKHPKTPFG
jgi:hypothetical protein